MNSFALGIYMSKFFKDHLEKNPDLGPPAVSVL